MAAMQTISARIPSEDLEWLATYEMQGATTPSDKVRALVTQIRRQHEGSMDYGASLARSHAIPSASWSRSKKSWSRGSSSS